MTTLKKRSVLAILLVAVLALSCVMLIPAAKKEVRAATSTITYVIEIDYKTNIGTDRPDVYQYDNPTGFGMDVVITFNLHEWFTWNSWSQHFLGGSTAQQSAAAQEASNLRYLVESTKIRGYTDFYTIPANKSVLISFSIYEINYRITFYDGFLPILVAFYTTTAEDNPIYLTKPCFG